jgi:ligand-binding sensor domain-containing protein
MNKQISFNLGLSLFILVLINYLEAGALSSRKLITQYMYDTWTTKEGFPHNWIDDIVQTKDGYLWIGTSIGLVRFDGIKFTVFDKSNTKELQSKRITKLCAGTDGSLWIGTLGGGLSHLKDGRFTTYTTQDGLAHNVVSDLLEAQDKTIWIATEEGLSHLKDGRFTSYTTHNGLRNNKVSSIAQDSQGTIWIAEDGNYNSLLLLKDKGFSIYDLQGKSINGPIYATRHGKIWIPTHGELLKYENNNLHSYPIKHLKESMVRSLLFDRDGNLWLAAKGLLRFKEGKVDAFTSDDGLLDNYIYSLYEDQEGSLWIGDHSIGLGRLRDGKFIAYTTKEGLSTNYVTTVYEDYYGTLWTNAGRFNPLEDNKWKNYNPQEGLLDTSIISIAETSDRSIWLATETGRTLHRYKNGKFSEIFLQPPLKNKTIPVLYTDKEDGLWIGTTAGLGRLKNDSLTIYTKANGLSSDQIRAIVQDKENNIWIGTFDNGLNLLKDGKFITFNINSQISSQSITSLYCDKAGTVWIGTNGGGLCRYKDGKFSNYTITDGLSDDVTFTILEDDKENLWMGSEKGIYRVMKKSIDDFDLGKVKRIESVSYGTEDGMASNLVKGGTQPVACKSKDGRLWFSTMKGIIMIDPNNMTSNMVIPPVHLEGVKIDGQVVSFKERIVVPQDATELSIFYTATSLLIPPKVKFKYMLEGFDKDWVEAASTRREAHYTNLPPGNYHFKVVASNNDGIWNKVGVGLDIYKRPFFHQTYWFYILCISLIGLLGWTLYYLRMVQLRSKFSAILAERNRIAREVHDTLIQGMIGTSAQLDAISMMLFTSPLAAKQHLDQLRVMVRQSIDEARRSVWNIRHLDNEHGNLGKLLLNFAEEANKNSKINISLQTQGHYRLIDPEVEKNIVRIGQEAIINSIKHAKATHIIIALSYSQQYLRLCIRDDGCGFDIDQEYQSQNRFGILGMHERAKEIKGQLTINSSPGIGTEIILVASIT